MSSAYAEKDTAFGIKITSEDDHQIQSMTGNKGDLNFIGKADAWWGNLKDQVDAATTWGEKETKNKLRVAMLKDYINVLNTELGKLLSQRAQAFNLAHPDEIGRDIEPLITAINLAFIKKGQAIQTNIDESYRGVPLTSEIYKQKIN